MNLVPQSQLCNIYHALIESHLRYANVVWGSIPSSKLEVLQCLQNRARSIIQKAKIKDKWREDLLSVEQWIRFDQLTLTYKMMNRICPGNLLNKYKIRNQCPSYNTRHCRDLQIPRYNLEYKKKSFNYSSIKAWNSIPLSIRDLPTLQQFKNDLKKHLRS